MSTGKKPDNYTDEANILPYGSNISAPAITIPDVGNFKDERSTNAKNYFETALQDLNDKYAGLLELAKDSEMVYSAKYNFVPKVGHVYHLYWTGEEYTLSLIENWKRFQYVGSFRFNADNVWEREDESRSIT